MRVMLLRESTQLQAQSGWTWKDRHLASQLLTCIERVCVATSSVVKSLLEHGHIASTMG